ncbi:MAG: hypothetical protein IZT59_09265 [Verrucomicrobia bacterium]|jgi:hypothetical protein|nr:hypothetical protein [Verrucomicrobiota bacterium]|tara:strand:- start:61939 stop:62250 length:312 start_codon:yes stop_codon:yes gene_type:complete
MKIIFDENVPWLLRQFLTNHEVTSVPREGYGGIENGELLAKLEEYFDIFILADKNLRYQQNLRERTIAIIELPTNRWPILKSLREEITSTVDAAPPGSYTVID